MSFGVSGSSVSAGTTRLIAVASQSTQSVPDSSNTQLAIDTADYDPESIISLINDDFTIPRDGFYEAGMTGQWAANATGGERIGTITASTSGQILKISHDPQGVSIGADPMAGTGVLKLVAGETVQMDFFFQDSGGALNITIVRFWLKEFQSTA